MPKEEIIVGLRNAIERGYSIEQAKKSFISAGYPLKEVEEASRFIDTTAVEKTPPTEMLQEEMTPPTPQEPEIKETEKPIAEEKAPVKGKGRKNFKIILFLIILLILIAIFILTLIFREKIIELFA